MKKRILLFGLVAAMLVTGLSGCKKSSPADASEPAADVPVITDLTAGDAQTHVSVYPQTFTEGEQVENLYYKRAADANGVPCYEVRTSPDAEEYEMLPLNDTVVYTDPNRSECYYETVKLEYKRDGEPVTALQYQLYVSAYVDDGTGEAGESEPETVVVENAGVADDGSVSDFVAVEGGETSELESDSSR